MKTIVGGKEYLDYAGELIRNGQIVGMPTETVYGLAANAFDEEAVKYIFECKGRPQDNPLIVHISSPSEVNRVAIDIPDEAYKLWEVFSPGPLTLVLKKQKDLPLRTTGGLNTVGIRIPDHELALGLIRASDCPIAAPSANTSGRVSPTEAMHVFEDMNGKIPLILDGGKTRVGIESTVLDLTKEIPTILRPGFITADMLCPYLGTVKTHKGEVLVAEAPGMKYKHYAPICPCVGIINTHNATVEYNRLQNEGFNPVLIASKQMIDNANVKNFVSLGETPESAMAELFSALRQCEKEYNYILLQWFEDESYFSVQNRIKKSVGGIHID